MKIKSLVLLAVGCCCWWRCVGGGVVGGGCDYDKARGSIVCDVDDDGIVRLPYFNRGVPELLLKCGRRPHVSLLTKSFQRLVGCPFKLVGDCVGRRRGVVDGGWLLTEDARLRFEQLGVGAAERRAAGVAVDVAAGERRRLRVRLGEEGGPAVEIGSTSSPATPTQKTVTLSRSAVGGVGAVAGVVISLVVVAAGLLLLRRRRRRCVQAAAAATAAAIRRERSRTRGVVVSVPADSTVVDDDGEDSSVGGAVSSASDTAADSATTLLPV
ncbi:MAG: hypothetical protein GY739_05925 [Mesoflavibacter sp.]|nr:hypothetical protein [Mesoflavibacter sp.]